MNELESTRGINATVKCFMNIYTKIGEMKRIIMKKRLKFLLTISLVSSIAIYLFIFEQAQTLFPFGPWSRKLPNKVSLPYTVVHLDLKGSPPKLEYLESLLPMLSKLGVNGLLMEYEDMFPYEGRLVKLRAKNCYQRTKLKRFLSLAVKSGFEIIPLVQTFGHLEFVLKNKEFRHLREVPDSLGSICPSKEESLEVIKEMLKQMIDFHRKISPLKHFHVGCDEVYFLKQCEDCVRRPDRSEGIFFKHLQIVGEMVNGLSKDTIVLVWDDMFRTLKPLKWTKLERFKNIEPVYWNYQRKGTVSDIALYQYHKKFPNIWIASAFKGADGIQAVIPNLFIRYLNHFSWMQNIFGYKFGGETEVYEFKGIILTGWSRYSHMDPMCELLPASMPSLILNLLLINKFKAGFAPIPKLDNRLEFYSKYLLQDFSKTLNCTNIKSVSLEVMDFFTCNFSGRELYDALKYLFISNRISNNENDLLLEEYYTYYVDIKKNADTRKHDMKRYKYMTRIESDIHLSNIMKKYYDNDVINEYVDSQIKLSKKILEEDELKKKLI